jgi:hypothetical protein
MLREFINRILEVGDYIAPTIMEVGFGVFLCWFVAYVLIPVVIFGDIPPTKKSK